MSYQIIHIVKCDCCGRSWKSESFKAVNDKVESVEFRTPGGTSSLQLCEDCCLDAGNAVRNIYEYMADGKNDVSVRGYRSYNRYAFNDDPIDLDVVEEDE